MAASHANVMMVRRQLSTSSSTEVPTIWMVAWITLAKLLLSASATVSTSLVKKLMMSPERVVSKYESGSVWICANRSARMSDTTRCAARTMVWV